MASQWFTETKSFVFKNQGAKCQLFWDKDGVIFVDYLQQDQTITGVYYALLLDRLHSEVKKKRRGKLSRKVIYLHNNASPHKSNVAVQKLATLV